MNRKPDVWTSRYAGPEDRAQGEWRGHRVIVLDEIDADFYRVRFPCGTVSKAHHNHLTYPFAKNA